MLNTIIALADIHIRPLKRHEEFKKVFNQLILSVKDERPDRLVIAGDLFHNKISISNEISLILAKLLNALAKYTKIIIIPGNHDALINSSRLDSISPIIEMINNENIVYYKHSGTYEDKWDNDTVWCVWSCLENQKNPEIKAYKSFNDLEGKKCYIGLYHGVINGSTTDTGFTFTDEGVEKDEFFETDFFIAGDIHKYQTFDFANYRGKGFGVMVGSLIQQNFGESSENHGFILLENEKSGWKHTLNELENESSFHTFEMNSFEELNNL